MNIFPNGKVIDLEQGTNEWLEYRKKKITASEVAMAMNKSPYMTAYQLYNMKKGLYQPKADDYIFQRGHEFEEIGRQVFKDLTGEEMIPFCVESVINPNFFASLDGFNSKFGLFEHKLVGEEEIKKIENGEIREDHIIQMNFQMLTSGIETTQYMATTPKKKKAIVSIDADEELQQLIAMEAEEFMKKIQKNIAPKLSNKDYLIPQDDEIRNLFQEMEKLKAEEEILKSKIESLKKNIVENAPHEKVLCGGLMLYKSTRKGKVNYKKIPELVGVDLEQYRGKESEVWTIKYNKGA